MPLRLFYCIQLFCGCGGIISGFAAGILMKTVMGRKVSESKGGGNCISFAIQLKVLKKKDSLGYRCLGQFGVFRQHLRQEKMAQNQIRNLVDQLFDGDPVKLIENILGNKFMDKSGHNTAFDTRKLRLAN
jgi:hypothetical protein